MFLAAVIHINEEELPCSAVLPKGMDSGHGYSSLIQLHMKIQLHKVLYCRFLKEHYVNYVIAQDEWGTAMHILV